MTGPAADPGLDLQFPPKPEYVRAARLAVGAAARLHDAPDELVEDVKLAVTEACVTALSGVETGTGSIRVLAFADGRRLTVEVVDHGSHLERAVAGDPTELDTGDLPFDRMLSLPLIRGLVDELAIEPRDGGGASIRMVLGWEERTE